MTGSVCGQYGWTVGRQRCVCEPLRGAGWKNELGVIWQEMRWGNTWHGEHYISNYIRREKRSEWRVRDNNRGGLILVYPDGKLCDPDSSLMSPPVFLACPITPALPVPSAVMSQDSWGCHVHSPGLPSALSLSLSFFHSSISSIPLRPETVTEARTTHTH